MIYTDHQGLQYFNTKRWLNSRQANWYLELSVYDYLISYKPGAAMGKPEAFTRRTGNEKSGAEERIFAPGQLEIDAGLKDDRLEDMRHEDNIYRCLLMSLEGHNDVEYGAEDVDIDGIDCAEWGRDEEGLLKVPDNHINDMLRQCHDSKVAGHWGRTRTQELVSRNFTWDNWKKDAMHYVATCLRKQI